MDFLEPYAVEREVRKLSTYVDTEFKRSLLLQRKDSVLIGPHRDATEGSSVLALGHKKYD